MIERDDGRTQLGVSFLSNRLTTSYSNFHLIFQIYSSDG
jgi:hypothetical protein